MDEKRSRLKVVMVPWLAHGHISPFTELAKKLANRKIFVYLCYTPINFTSIKKRITQKYFLSIKLVEFHLPSLPDLPSHYHTTNGLPSHLLPTLQSALKMATSTFSSLLQSLSPDLLVYDFNQLWAPSIASSHNIPGVQFITAGALVLSFGLHFFKKRCVEFPFPTTPLQEFHLKKFRDSMKDSGSEAVKESGEIMDAVERSSSVIMLNTCRELEGKYIDYVAVLTGKKIVPVGPLVQETVCEDEHEGIIKWLDKKGDSSTVFVSCGSENYLSREEMVEVARGLEISEVNFIWVVRFPIGEQVKIEEALPRGYFERIGERGLVVEGWVPEAQILAHSSTGGFVSHSGWNSVLESVKFGVPIIAMPVQNDQPRNARLVDEVGVAVEITRDKNGRINRKDISQKIRMVMVEKNGERMRLKARELRENLRMKREGEIDEVVEELVRICKEKK